MVSSTYTVFCDGSCRGNPGQGGTAFAVFSPLGELLYTANQSIGKCTGNEAEYLAVENALEFLASKGIRDVVVKSDSELVVKQIWGEYQVKEPRLKNRHVGVTRMISEFDSVRFESVPRAENKIADKLAKKASEGKDEGLVPHSIKKAS